MTIEKYTELLHMLSYLKIIPVDEQIWMRNLSLNWKHADPADRTIVATTMIHHTSIVTADENIRLFFDKHVW